MVAVELPEPGAAIELGLNVAVAPVGRPLAVSATAALNPPEIAVVTVDDPDAPCTTESEGGESEIEKSGVDAAVTVSVMVAVWVVPPPDPVTVTVYVPTGVDALVVIVAVELPDPGAAMELGLNDALAPVGRPDAERETAELKEPEIEVEIV